MVGKQKKRPVHLPRTPEQIEAVRQRIKEQTEAYQRMKQEQRPANPFAATRAPTIRLSRHPNRRGCSMIGDDIRRFFSPEYWLWALTLFFATAATQVTAEDR